jgi:hypothetical protein
MFETIGSKRLCCVCQKSGVAEQQKHGTGRAFPTVLLFDAKKKHAILL